MTPIYCMATWTADGKEHYCILPLGHTRKCVCDCGERGYAANQPPAKWEPKPYYKRQKGKTR